MVAESKGRSRCGSDHVIVRKGTMLKGAVSDRASHTAVLAGWVALMVGTYRRRKARSRTRQARLMLPLAPPTDSNPVQGTPTELVHNLFIGQDVPASVGASRRVADAARRVIAGISAPHLPVDTLNEVADRLEDIARTLGPIEHMTRWPGPLGAPDEVHRDPLAFEWHPLIGPSHPLAPPLKIERDGDHAVGTATFSQVYEGPPGAVHGGVIAAMFDVMLISAASISHVAGLTGTLTVRYRKPTPLRQPIRYESWIDEVLDRKAMVKGISTFDGEVLAEAEGIFIRILR